MATVVKIKIEDVSELRKKLDSLYDNSSQKEIAQWSLKIAQRVLEKYAPSYVTNQIILDGFSMNRNWQQDINIKMYDVRQAGFAIHRLAKAQESEIIRTALRVVGQACASAHMKEHGMVASDYAIKCCNIVYPNDQETVKRERIWQIKELKNICDKTLIS
ncbi:putative immunity protein [Streptococcus respiraculi]|uniref:putative immunity protein n=1 Tax=Streptococcus respiraculi TaxID=2021971 RepID=UPI000E728954|nr:hypothetical protein [Streptococcus respiraculi]